MPRREIPRLRGGWRRAAGSGPRRAGWAGRDRPESPLRDDCPAPRRQRLAAGPPPTPPPSRGRATRARGRATRAALRCGPAP